MGLIRSHRWQGRKCSVCSAGRIPRGGAGGTYAVTWRPTVVFKRLGDELAHNGRHWRGFLNSRGGGAFVRASSSTALPRICFAVLLEHAPKSSRQSADQLTWNWCLHAEAGGGLGWIRTSALKDYEHCVTLKASGRIRHIPYPWTPWTLSCTRGSRRPHPASSLDAKIPASNLRQNVD